MSSIVYFDLVDRANMVFMVRGCLAHLTQTYSDPPAPLVKDSKVTLLKGKFPLDDYKDTSNYAKHKYTFRLPDQTTLTGILHGFTYDCTYDSQSDYGTPQVSVEISPTGLRPDVHPEVRPEVLPEVRPDIHPEVLPEVRPDIHPEVRPDIPIQRSRGE
jgi:hypothetical protein